LVSAFQGSQNKEPEIYARWIRMSHMIGSRLPQSLLSVSIQHLGELDLLCRAIERELLQQPPRNGEMDFRPNYLGVLSDLWIGSAYAICYTLRGRKILFDENFLALADDLRKIRVQTEKYEVPSDKKLTEPLRFSPTQLRADETEAPIFIYDKDDPLRAHIPRKGLSNRRSYMWEVFDIKAESSFWFERLELADRMLNLLSPPENP
jgi:hypothetical protein